MDRKRKLVERNPRPFLLQKPGFDRRKPVLFLDRVAFQLVDREARQQIVQPVDEDPHDFRLDAHKFFPLYFLSIFC